MTVKNNVTALKRVFILFIAWSCLSPTANAELTEGIVWYGVLEDGLKEAIVTGKPVLLTSAAPQCSSVPGMW